MGLSGFYQETPWSPKLTGQTPKPFLLYLTGENTLYPGRSSPRPLPPRPIFRLQASANLPSLARYFFPPRGPAALGAALLRGGATRRHLQDCFRALLSRRVAGRRPGARQGRQLRGGGTGDARARRRRPPSLPPSLALGTPSRALPRAVASPRPEKLLSGRRFLFPSSLRHVGQLTFFFFPPFLHSKKFLL